MGNLSYTAGNPTLLSSAWNVDIQSGISPFKVNKKPSSQYDTYPTTDIQLDNYNVTEINWLLNILGYVPYTGIYAKAEVWETRDISILLH